MVQRAFVIPPASRIGPLSADERRAAIESSLIYGHYEKLVDRESAFEKLQGQQAVSTATPAQASNVPAGQGNASGGFGDMLGGLFGGGGNSAPSRGRGREPDSLGSVLAKSAIRTIGSSLGREIVRGVLGSILGGRR